MTLFWWKWFVFFSDRKMKVHFTSWPIRFPSFHNGWSILICLGFSLFHFKTVRYEIHFLFLVRSFIFFLFFCIIIFTLVITEESQAKRLKVDVESATERADPASSAVIISEALARFLGTREKEMEESEPIRLVWEYIKVNHLEVGSQVHISLFSLMHRKKKRKRKSRLD